MQVFSLHFCFVTGFTVVCVTFQTSELQYGCSLPSEPEITCANKRAKSEIS